MCCIDLRNKKMKYIYIKRLRKLGEDGDFSLTFILYWIANPTDQDKQIEFKWSLFYMNNQPVHAVSWNSRERKHPTQIRGKVYCQENLEITTTSIWGPLDNSRFHVFPPQDCAHIYTWLEPAFGMPYVAARMQRRWENHTGEVHQMQNGVSVERVWIFSRLHNVNNREKEWWQGFMW